MEFLISFCSRDGIQYAQQIPPLQGTCYTDMCKPLYRTIDGIDLLS